jgi:hypothetical protein
MRYLALWLVWMSAFQSFRFSHTSSPLTMLRLKPELTSDDDSMVKISKPFNLLVLLPVPMAIFGWYEAAHPAITTWIEPTFFHPPTTSWKYFVSGGLSACFSHAITVPFDVVKTKMQTSPKLAQCNLPNAVASIVKDEGLGVLLTGNLIPQCLKLISSLVVVIGLLPTSSGFFIHGSLKYGLYELFKPAVKLWLLSEGIAADKMVIFMLASMAAEMIGSLSLSPFETTRIRLVAEPAFASSAADCARKITGSQGLGGLYVSLPPLLLKNVPYTVLQLSSFEFFSSFIYSYLAAQGKLAS